MTPRQNDTPTVIAAHFLRACRVRDWLHFLALPFVMVNPSGPDVPALVRGVVLSVLVLAFAYGWNTVKDDHWGEAPRAGSDRPPVLPSTTRFVTIVLFVLAALAVGGAAFTNPLVFVATLVAMVASAVYSGGPRLKARPVIGTLLNVGVFVPLCFLGASSADLSRPHVVLAVLFGLLLLQNQLIHEAAHYMDDTEDDIMTTVARFGLRWGLVVSHAFGLLSMATIGWIYVTYPSTWLALVALVPLLYVHFALTPSRFNDVRLVTVLRRRHRYLGLSCGALVWIAVLFQFTGI